MRAPVRGLFRASPVDRSAAGRWEIWGDARLRGEPPLQGHATTIFDGAAHVDRDRGIVDRVRQSADVSQVRIERAIQSRAQLRAGSHAVGPGLRGYVIERTQQEQAKAGHPGI